jgi:hypothetical protein
MWHSTTHPHVPTRLSPADQQAPEHSHEGMRMAEARDGQAHPQTANTRDCPGSWLMPCPPPPRLANIGLMVNSTGARPVMCVLW